MKLIIDIPEEDYKGICHLKNEQLRMLPVEVAETLIRIANGTHIPDNATVCDIEQIRDEIEELDRYYDNDYFSTNNCPMYKCSEVLLIIDKYKAKREEQTE